jgi:hypothetical protein
MKTSFFAIIALLAVACATPRHIKVNSPLAHPALSIEKRHYSLQAVLAYGLRLRPLAAVNCYELRPKTANEQSSCQAVPFFEGK